METKPTTFVAKVILDRKQTAFVEKSDSNGTALFSGTVEEIGELMNLTGCEGCKIVFNTAHAPNFTRCFNAFVKRARRIAEFAGVSISGPEEYFIAGHRQHDKWVMETRQ